MVPLIAEPCTAQSYWYVPGAVNVTEWVAPLVLIALLVKLVELVEPNEWTLCGSEPVQVQVTVLPVGMVSTAGF
jgi:hypothetical protein